MPVNNRLQIVDAVLYLLFGSFVLLGVFHIGRMHERSQIEAVHPGAIDPNSKHLVLEKDHPLGVVTDNRPNGAPIWTYVEQRSRRHFGCGEIGGGASAYIGFELRPESSSVNFLLDTDHSPIGRLKFLQ